MVLGHVLDLAGHLLQRHELGALRPAVAHHDAEPPVRDRGRPSDAEPGAEEAVGGVRGAAALHVAEDRHAGLETSALLELGGQREGVGAVRCLEAPDAALGGGLRLRGGGVLDEGLGVLDLEAVGDVESALGDGHDGEGGAVGAAPLDLLDDGVHGVRDLGQEDDVGATGDARSEGQPAGAVAHDLGEDDAVVGVRRRVEAVDGLRGDLEGGREAEGGVGLDDVVVDGLREVEDVEAGVHEPAGVLRGAAAAQADEGVEVVLLVVLDDGRDHVPLLAVNDHAVHLVPTGAEHGASDGEDARQRGGVELGVAVLGQPAHAVAEADELPAVLLDRRLAEAADRGVESRGVSAGGQDPDALGSHARSMPVPASSHRLTPLASRWPGRTSRREPVHSAAEAARPPGAHAPVAREFSGAPGR